MRWQQVARNAARRHVAVFISGAAPAVRQLLATHGVEAPLVRYETTLDAAFAAGHQLLAAQEQAFPA